MSPDEAVQAACGLIESARAARPRVTVAIDGGAGAGKSTLAHGIRDRLGAVSILRADHFFRPLNEDRSTRLAPEEAYLLYFPWQRMRDEALLPLRRGETARYQRHDWETDRLNQWIQLDSKEIILVEGVYSARPELRPFVDFAIFVDTPRAERLRRMVARGHLARDPKNDWLKPWMAAEDWYFSNVRPAEHARLVVAGI
ncbi:MAG: uridine kinase family protein [Candidatus Binatus sp.]